MTVAQVSALGASDPLAGKRGRPGIDALLAHADSLYGAGANAGAATAYAAVLDQAPAEWPQYGRTVEALLFSLSDTDQAETCVRVAGSALPKLRGSPHQAAVATYGLDCALELPEGHADRARLIAEFESACRAVLADTTLMIAGDDRSGIYGSLVSARSDAHDSTGHMRVSAEWASFLEREAARAKTPEQRAVFDPHRLSAYLELGQPERAIPMLEQSHRDFPDDYNPLARLAAAYRAMKQWDKATAAADEAMAKAYGPRKLRIFDTRVGIHTDQGDSTTAKRVLEEALHYAEALPDGQRSESTVANLRKRLEKFR
jgi:tetratricopeptide (TPR) repeat protein